MKVITYEKLKRAFDFILSAFTMVIFSPLFVIIYLSILCVDGYPVLFRQERVGKGGRVFRIYKFRTMSKDAEKMGPMLCKGKDPRLTKFGRHLRVHHLDELPQLWNVFVGDMSFVGPRPERQFYIDKIIERDNRYPQILVVRPGVTSYATLYNGYTVSMEKMLRRLRLDLFYVKHSHLPLTLLFLSVHFFV